MKRLILSVCLLGSWHLCHGLQLSSIADADSIADAYHGASITNLKALSDSLTQHFDSDALKFRSIFTWVCKNIQSDYALLKEQKRNQKKFQHDSTAWRAWQEKFSQKLFRKLISEKKTICSGYSFLVDRLSYHAGIQCRIINGYARTAKSNIGGIGTVNHSWNAVNLDGAWFLSDATWASGQISSNDLKFKPFFDDVYFMVQPKVFIQDHYPLDTSWSLLDKTPTREVFLKAPVIYKGAYNYELVFERFMINKINLEFEVTFYTSRPIKEDLIVRNGKIPFKNITIELQNLRYTIRFKVRKEGVYHLLIGGQPAFTVIPNLINMK